MVTTTSASCTTKSGSDRVKFVKGVESRIENFRQRAVGEVVGVPLEADARDGAETKSDPVLIVAVAPVHNRKNITLQGLATLLDARRDWMSLEVIIVDDGSTDGTAEAIRRCFPQVEILRGDGTLFYTKGTNLGLERALDYDPDYVLAMNDDSIFHVDSLAHLVRRANRCLKSVVGPLLLSWERPLQLEQNGAEWSTFGGGWRWTRGGSATDLDLAPIEVDLLPGNCMLIPRQAIEEVGLMKGDAFPYGWGDAEYTPRMARAGWNLLMEPRAWVWTEPPELKGSLGSLPPIEAAREFLLNRRRPDGVVHSFLSRWHGAPTRLQGLAAFGCLMGRRLFTYAGRRLRPTFGCSLRPDRNRGE